MGNLSNLYISQSYQSLIHLGNDSFVSSSLVGLQDGLGNSIGVAVNSAGDLSISGSFTSSLQQGYALVGNNNGKTIAVPTSSFAENTDLGPLNQFTASQESKDITLGLYTGSVNQKFSTIGTQSGSWDNTLLNQFTSSQESKNNTLATYTGSVNTQLNTIGQVTASLNSYTASNDTKWNTLGSQSGSFVLESETGSFASTNVNNVFGGNQTFNNITVNGTASIAYIEAVTGSAKIIGDAFIILNNDTPAERYAGIIVQDSGSANTSASFQYDGVSNDWFYEYTGSDPLNFGVALFGPEYGVKGAPIYNTNNRIVKGNGGHHIIDSNISDDGTNVSINSNTQITGSLLINGNAPLINSNLAPLNTFTSSQESKNSTLATYTGSVDTKFSTIGGQSGSWDNTSLNAFTASQQVLNNKFATTGSNVFNGNQTILNGGIDLKSNIEGSGSAYTGIAAIIDTTTDPTNVYSAYGLIKPVSGDALLSMAINSYSPQYGTATPMILADGNNPDGNNTAIGFPSNGNMDVWKKSIFNYGVEITGSLNLTGNLTSSLQEGYVWVGGAGNRTITAATSSFGGSTDLGPLNSFTASQEVLNAQFASTGSETFTGVVNFLSGVGIRGQSSFATGFILETINVQNVSGSLIYNKVGPASNVDLQNLSLLVSGTFTSSLQEGYVWVGDSTGKTMTVPTSSFVSTPIVGYATTGSNVFVGNQQITGSLSVSGSINTSVIPLAITSNTASLNASTGNTFQLNLVSGTATRLEISGTQSGQTINLLVSQSASGPGTFVFGDNIVEPSGSFYSASQVASGEDILTMATFINPNKIYVANVKNFI